MLVGNGWRNWLMGWVVGLSSEKIFVVDRYIGYPIPRGGRGMWGWMG